MREAGDEVNTSTQCNTSIATNNTLRRTVAHKRKVAERKRQKAYRMTQQKKPGWYEHVALIFVSSTPPIMYRQCCEQRAQYWYTDVVGAMGKLPAQLILPSNSKALQDTRC